MFASKLDFTYSSEPFIDCLQNYTNATSLQTKPEISLVSQYARPQHCIFGITNCFFTLTLAEKI